MLCIISATGETRRLPQQVALVAADRKPPNPKAPADARAIFTRGALRPLVASRTAGGLQYTPLSRITVGRMPSL